MDAFKNYKPAKPVALLKAKLPQGQGKPIREELKGLRDNMDGPYKIQDWNDQEEVEAKVRQKVHDLMGLKKKNMFDDAEKGAPEALKEEINQAKCEDESTRELKKKREIIDKRNEAYQLYPKYTLAKLISESYNAFGLAYFWQCGNRQTSEYYFGQAVIWLYDSLGFEDNSSDTNMGVLLSIKQRYSDIEYVCTNDKIEKIYSRKIGEAYAKLINDR